MGLIAQAFDAKEGKCVGTVVCKMGEHRGAFRGYIAMLVVLKPYRGRGIGDTFLPPFTSCFPLFCCSRHGVILLYEVNGVHLLNVLDIYISIVL